MADRAAARRVKRYRTLQKLERGIAYVEVQVPAVAAEDVKLVGRKLQDARPKLARSTRPAKPFNPRFCSL